MNYGNGTRNSIFDPVDVCLRVWIYEGLNVIIQNSYSRCLKLKICLNLQGNLQWVQISSFPHLSRFVEYMSLFMISKRCRRNWVAYIYGGNSGVVINADQCWAAGALPSKCFHWDLENRYRCHPAPSRTAMDLHSICIASQQQQPACHSSLWCRSTSDILGHCNW